MIRAIDDYQITGVETTLGFCKFVMKHEAFVSGNFDTGFIGKYYSPEMLVVENDDEATIAALVGAKLISSKKKSTQRSTVAATSNSLWKLNRLSE
jgi:acetyl/propionyl-CoA carboxylase alpha subunit